MDTLAILFFSCIIFGIIGCIIGQRGGRDDGPPGFFLGFFLGPIGLILTALLFPPEKAGPAAPTADGETQRKIALLEAQLAELKGPAKPALREDDGGIPTYKLD